MIAPELRSSALKPSSFSVIGMLSAGLKGTDWVKDI